MATEDSGSTEVSQKFGEKREFRSFNRPLSMYEDRLFPDDEEVKEKFKSGPPQPPQFLYAHYYSPQTIKREVSLVKGVPSEYDDLLISEIGTIDGGKTGFFKQGSRILDIGSGGGTAVTEINRKYKHKDIKAVGLDIRYTSRQSVKAKGEKRFVGGEWGKMPFADDSFDRLLSYESFPKYGMSRNQSVEDYKKVFKEITRISEVGTIWRGTYGTSFAGDGMPTPAAVMTSNGWEVYVFPTGDFVAVLSNK